MQADQRVFLNTFFFTDNTSTTLLAERNPCIRRKTEALDNPSLLLGMYYAVVSLVIFSAVMIVSYIALFIFAKR